MTPAPALAAADPDFDLLPALGHAVTALDAFLARATRAVRLKVERNGRVASDLVDAEQRAAHGLAWVATYVEALRELAAYAERLSDAGRFGDLERAIVEVGFAEYI